MRTGRLDAAKEILDIQWDGIAENEYWITIPEEFNITLVQRMNMLLMFLCTGRYNNTRMGKRLR
ncbi:hypothetical protein F3157_13515 [Virgibacillus dakarensis]|uniref:Uncharacterized protein n=1 Tax=Lentibacillus populi TaxID=1827502 RepID=A0A9W5TU56_9BACI|nr:MULTISPECIES: hypothetical protein [Bacillaceae]MBT2216719.1 hypothetical protein [Virgibacillus dakarensis]MTW86670.1 hypothetical protein [Virgibacillus dakarensis]GGB29934.1 hypothetical protein GCM10011409_04090 [Lentibacillus populi]